MAGIIYMMTSPALERICYSGCLLLLYFFDITFCVTLYNLYTEKYFVHILLNNKFQTWLFWISI